MKIKYCRIRFIDGKFKTIKGCRDLSFDEYLNRNGIFVNCTDGRIYIFNWNLIQEFKLWEEEEKDENPEKRSRKKVSPETTGDKGDRPGDSEASGETSGSHKDDDT